MKETILKNLECVEGRYKCPDCNESLIYVAGLYKCPSCGAFIFKVYNQNIHINVDEINCSEFNKEIKNTIGYKLVKSSKVSESYEDAKLIITNKRLERAYESMQGSEFDEALEELQCLPQELFEVSRLTFLSKKRIKNEYMLSLNKESIYDDLFNEFIRDIKDENLIYFYKGLAERCEENQKIYQEMQQELQVIYEMLDLNLDADAIFYAKKACGKYPLFYESWGALASCCYKKDKRKALVALQIMEQCPDYNKNTLSIKVSNLIGIIKNNNLECHTEKEGIINLFKWLEFLFFALAGGIGCFNVALGCSFDNLFTFSIILMSASFIISLAIFIFGIIPSLKVIFKYRKDDIFYSQNDIKFHYKYLIHILVSIILFFVDIAGVIVTIIIQLGYWI